ncbi:Citrate lyase subunit beta-like protein [Paraconexibacter sp. AEG42_29]|uniref:Citrate lyase subunit beta-like protein n=1 Tax=Paraconexibacter sp. AEG42_29 TaxID=2997339 RepID=A0AAU7B0R2_9ACTN
MRSLLFAPAVRPDLVAKLPRSRPGAGVIDLEDGVPEGRKDAARAALAGQVAGLLERHPGFAVCVRVNAPPTASFAADVAALPAGLTAVVVPKVEDAQQLEQVARALAAAGHDGLGVVAGIETARGVLDVRALLGGPVTTAYFGAEDYVADLGGVRTKHSTEVLYARSRVALACRVAGIPCLDQVVVDIHDDDAFRADARQGRELGYTGKLCVHPRQVALADEAFLPSPEQLARARATLEAAAAAARDGQGVIVFDGAMVDEPMLVAARRLIAGADGPGN